MESKELVPHTHVIEARTVEELKSKVFELAAAFGGSGQMTGAGFPIVSAPTVAPQAVAPEAQAIAKEAPKSKKAKKEAAPVEKAPEPVEEPVEEESDPFGDEDEAPTAAISFEQVNEALQKLGGSKGVAPVRDILASLGVKKVKELKESDYQKVMELVAKA